MLHGFDEAHRVITKTLPVKMTPRQVWEQAERVGRDLVNRRDEEERKMLEGRPPKPPANPPDLLVCSPPVGRNRRRSGRSGDGGRIQDRSRPPGDRWCEYKAAVVYRVERETGAREGARPDPEPAPHWRYAAGKDGFARVESGEKTYSDPEPETKTFTASTEGVERFPLHVELEARRRGLMEARTVCFVGDGGEFVWRTAREVCEARALRGKRVFEVLDIIHAGEHLVDAAKAAFGCTEEGAEWLDARLGELWGGDADDLVEALEAKAEELGPRPGPEGSATRVAWNARDYFDTHRDRIRYDTFRRHGLPLTSCHVESAIKQANRRVKGSEKQWDLDHAEEMLALRCFALSQDGRWDEHFDALRRGEVEVPTPGRVRTARDRTESAPRHERAA
jgi:hypothetical protein